MGNTKSQQEGENINNNSIALTTSDNTSELKNIKDVIVIICVMKALELLYYVYKMFFHNIKNKYRNHGNKNV